MDIYSLSRNFFNWCFDNPEKVNSNHVALYFFCIENCNRLGWKEKFGLPTTMAKEAIGIKNFRTYKKTLTDLVDFGFIKMIEVSKNQYSSNVIAIVKNAKAPTKALDIALQKHLQKHCKSTDSIDIQLYNNTIIPIYNSFDAFWNMYDKKEQKENCIKLWNKLSEEDKSKILEITPAYVVWKSDKKYRPNPQTFLNQKRWHDEIPNAITKKYVSQIPESENKW